MNLLNFIEVMDINTVTELKNMPICFKLINLHTQNLQEAINQCDRFFISGRELKDTFCYYTESSDYQWFGGWEYRLKKDCNNCWWLILQDNEKIEV